MVYRNFSLLLCSSFYGQQQVDILKNNPVEPKKVFIWEITSYSYNTKFN